MKHTVEVHVEIHFVFVKENGTVEEYVKVCQSSFVCFGFTSHRHSIGYITIYQL
jgi:hypothetical protein